MEKPLARGRMLRIKDRLIWIAFQYECIPEFCFNCGVIRHGENGFPKSRISRIHGEKTGTQFRPCLRATSPKKMVGQIEEAGGR